MKVLVIGASGGIGRHVVEEALAKGHEVTAFLRSPEKLKVEHPRLRVVAGDAEDAGAVRRAMQGHDAVLSAIGSNTRGSKVRSVGTANIIAAMKACGVRRIASVSAIGVGDSKPQAQRSSFVFGRIILPFMLAKPFADMAVMEDQLRDSGLEWLIVRPTGLSDHPPTGRWVAQGPEGKVRARIPRADVARFMVQSLEHDRYVRQAVSLYA